MTVKSPNKERLELFLSKVLEGLQKIIKKYKTRYLRGKGPLLIGIWSLECNFNQEKKTYNHHFHILVSNKEIADILKMEWLALWTSKFTSPKAQKVVKRQVWNIP